jgi:hypothetical protein
MLALCCVFCLPALAVDTSAPPAPALTGEESPKALSNRITEIEKANYVLHEDLARTRLELNFVISMLGSDVSKLKEGDLTSIVKNITAEIAAQQKMIDKNGANAGLTDEIAKLKQALADLNAKIAKGDFIRATSTPYGPHGHGDMVMMDTDSLPTRETYRVRIVNDVHGAITVSRDGGTTWEPLGHVLTPAKTVTTQSGLARTWGRSSVVADSAVDAIAIRTGYDDTTKNTELIYVLPKVTPHTAPAPVVEKPIVANVDDQMMLSTMTTVLPKVAPAPLVATGTAIQTDLPAGSGIFDAMGPIPGNPVSLEAVSGDREITPGFLPKAGDVFLVRVLQPTTSPKAYEFENCYGGFITMVNWDDSAKIVGQVLLPVSGIGRVDAATFVESGRLSAIANGALDISVSKRDIGLPDTSPTKAGGFHLQFSEWGMNAELLRLRSMPNVMVVSEFDARQPSWDGLAPLFLGYLHPRWSANDYASSDWKRLLTSRIRVDVKIDEGSWQPMPEFALPAKAGKALPDWTSTALQHVTNIRVNFPIPAGAEPPAKAR